MNAYQLSTLMLKVSLKLFKNLNQNKAYGHDNITEKCNDTIYKPLKMIFKPGLLTGVFPSEWKKTSRFYSFIKSATNKI